MHRLSIVVLLAAASGVAWGQEARRIPWRDLQGATEGKQVAVGLVDGSRLRGRITSVHADSLDLELRGGPRSVPRSDVSVVEYMEKKPAKWAALGAAIGAGGGAAAGYTAGIPLKNEGAGSKQAALTAAGAGAGAAIGCLAGRRANRAPVTLLIER